MVSPYLAYKIDLKDVIFVKNSLSLFFVYGTGIRFPNTHVGVYSHQRGITHIHLSALEMLQKLWPVSPMLPSGSGLGFPCFFIILTKRKEKKSLFVYMDFKMCAGWKRVETFGKLFFPNKKQLKNPVVCWIPKPRIKLL